MILMAQKCPTLDTSDIVFHVYKGSIYSETHPLISRHVSLSFYLMNVGRIVLSSSAPY